MATANRERSNKMPITITIKQLKRMQRVVKMYDKEEIDSDQMLGKILEIIDTPCPTKI